MVFAHSLYLQILQLKQVPGWPTQDLTSELYVMRRSVIYGTVWRLFAYLCLPRYPGTGNGNWDGYHLVRYPSSSFPDPWLFDTDPNTRIRNTYLRSRIIQILLRIQLRILLFSSVTFKIPTKNNLFFTAFLLIQVTFWRCNIILQR
jgi:hypothetical protein